MSCLLLGRKMDPGDLWVTLPYCSVEFPDTCSQTSVWPWIPVSVLCFCSPQPGVAVATLPSVLWDMACNKQRQAFRRKYIKVIPVEMRARSPAAE